jgi:outer membrane protein assembly factor BamA
LYRSGFFEEVNIQTSTTSARTADITVAVKQDRLRWIKAGIGWGSEERERLSLTLTHKNLFNRAYRGELFGTLSHIWREYKADFVNPYFWDTRTEQRTSVSWRSEQRDGYEFERLLGEMSFGHSFNHEIKTTWTPYRVKRTKTFNVNPEIAAITPELTDERTMALAFNRDTANDFFFPTRGTRNNLVLERTGGFFGGNVDFNKLSLESKWYRSIFKPVIFALAGRFGVIRPFSPTTEIPIFDRFFTGGGNSVRGYRERGVGPTDATGAPLGGNWMLGGIAEARFPIVWRFMGAVFIDGGQVADQFRGVETNAWKFGGGAGLRFKTPVGPFRLDYGHKLNPDSNDPDHWRLHFSLGESF